MTPWLVLAFVTAGINFSVFILVRARWDRRVPLLALAAVIGAILGNGLGDATGLEAIRIGDFNLLSASVVAQLAMFAATLVSMLAPARRAAS